MNLVFNSMIQDHGGKRGEFYGSWGLYILIHVCPHEPKPILQPPSLLSSIVAAIHFSFYLLTMSQLGRFSSTTAGDQRCNVMSFRVGQSPSSTTTSITSPLNGVAVKPIRKALRVA